MRKLVIETSNLETGQLTDSVSIPLVLVKAIVRIIPRQWASRFDEGGEQLQQLMDAVSGTINTGVVLDLADYAENERLVIRVIDGAPEALSNDSSAL
ncbi:hypothetical protein [Vibrio sp.]|uniref:hypothetical protein n=1 Tax=Vibrio sp. TaxID=678 RepID=UPI003D09ACBF